MTIYKWGTHALEYPALSGLASGIGNTISSPYTQDYIVVNAVGNAPGFEIDAETSVTELWFSFWLDVTSEFSGINIQFRDASDNIVARLLSNDNGADMNWFLQTYNGSAYTTVYTTSSVHADNECRRYDVRFKLDDAAGEFQLYRDKVLVGTFSGDTRTGTPTTISNVYITNTALSDARVSAWILADENTMDYVIHQPALNGNGFHTAWTGDYTAVDDAGMGTTDFITSSSTSDKESFTLGWDGTTFSSGYSVIAVKLGLAGRIASGDTAFVKGLIRISGTDYVSASHSLTTSFDNKIWEYTNSPATSSPWTWAEVAAAEYGIQAAAA